MAAENIAQNDFDEMADFLVDEAVRLLEKYGEFYPLGSALPLEGEAEYVMAYDGEERPESQDLIDLYIRAFKQDASKGTIRGAAIAYDILTRPANSDVKTDAIAVKLEHVSGVSIVWVYPYKLTDGKVDLGDGFTQRSERQIF